MGVVLEEEKVDISESRPIVLVHAAVAVDAKAAGAVNPLGVKSGKCLRLVARNQLYDARWERRHNTLDDP